MKRLLVIAAAFFLTACASAGTPRACPTLVVDNQNYHDVIVYLQGGSRVDRFPGLGLTTIRSCKLLRRPAHFRIIAFSNAWPGFTLRGNADYLQEDDLVYIIIGGSSSQSYIMGDEDAGG